MADFYNYADATLGGQTTIDGVTADYSTGLVQGASWSWSGTTEGFVIQTPDGNTDFVGDPNNEKFLPPYAVGGSKSQTVNIDGTDYAILWDYTFEVIDPATGETYRVAVLDVNLDGDGDVDTSENGYYLVFPDGPPPAGADLVIGEVTEDDNRTGHQALGATAVCFASGTLIETETGCRASTTLSGSDNHVGRFFEPL